jgi:hypothetical protein
MKKALMVFGGIFLVIVIALGGMGLFTWYKASQYEDTAVPYIKAAVPELSQWDPDLTKKYMVPKVLKETTDEKFAKIIKYLSKLGTLITLGEPSFTKIHTGATLEDGKQTVVTYTIDAVYEKGDATITMSLLDLGTSFQVYKFHIASLALAE